MTFTVEVHYGEGLPARDSRPFKDRASALNHALSLANDLGRTFSSGERGWAKWVSIRLDGKVDIAIQVIRGGCAALQTMKACSNSDRSRRAPMRSAVIRAMPSP